ncbi:hypothetical protein K2X30_13695 [bacterium]|nr:hypothetical protein [bacterium]
MGLKTFLITTLMTATLNLAMNFAHAYETHDNSAQGHERSSALFITADATMSEDPLYALCARRNTAAIAKELINLYPELRPQMSYIQPAGVTLSQLLDVTGSMAAQAVVPKPGDVSVAINTGVIRAIELNLDFSETFGSVSVVSTALKQEVLAVQDYRNMVCQTFSATPKASAKSLFDALKYEGGVERIEATVEGLPLRQ